MDAARNGRQEVAQLMDAHCTAGAAAAAAAPRAVSLCCEQESPVGLALRKVGDKQLDPFVCTRQSAQVCMGGGSISGEPTEAREACS